MLDNKKVILAADSDLMGILVMLCSRSEYVSHLHHEKDVNYILAELKYLLSLYNDRNEYKRSSALYAGK